MHLDRFSAWLHQRLSQLDEEARSKLAAAPWQQLAVQIAGSLPQVADDRRVLLVSWEHSGSGGVWLDADRQERAFADGPVDPRPLLDASEFFQTCFGVSASALPSQVFSATVECLTFLCAEVLVQNRGALVVAVQPGHDETPRVVFRSATPSTSIFDEQGAFLLPTDEELLERAPNEGHALAKLIETFGSRNDTISCWARPTRSFIGSHAAQSRRQIVQKRARSRPPSRSITSAWRSTAGVNSTSR